jgi:hypothetical protein
MPYTRPYSGGFVDFPATTTPINATALNTMDVGIKTANDQFQSVTTTERTALSPTVGQCVWDSDLRQIMVFMNAAGGNAWQPMGNVIICTSTTRPSTPFVGQRIFETDTKRWWTYIGSAFVPDDLVFTNEAARDTAITTPFEGQVAYLTAPTVPSASGDSYAATPTGVQTIYNGSVWVCVTPVSATTNTSGTTTSTSYTPTLTSGGTNPAVTIVTGTSALVQFHAKLQHDTALRSVFVSFAVSGATTLAAADLIAATNDQFNAAWGASVSRSFVVTGLTSGTNTFTMNYRGVTSGTLTASLRSITVQGVA